MQNWFFFEIIQMECGYSSIFELSPTSTLNVIDLKGHSDILQSLFDKGEICNRVSKKKRTFLSSVVNLPLHRLSFLVFPLNSSLSASSWKNDCLFLNDWVYQKSVASAIFLVCLFQINLQKSGQMFDTNLVEYF